MITSCLVLLSVGCLNEITNTTDIRNVYNKPVEAVASLWRDFLKAELEEKIRRFHLKLKFLHYKQWISKFVNGRIDYLNTIKAMHHFGKHQAPEILIKMKCSDLIGTATIVAACTSEVCASHQTLLEWAPTNKVRA